jgi:hypothetical protein
MAVVLTGTEADVRKEEQELADLTKTRHAAELLSTRVGTGGFWSSGLKINRTTLFEFVSCVMWVMCSRTEKK